MPTNPNRETGKDRWRRVPKDYFRTPDKIQGTKRNLWVLALILAVGWWAIGVNWKGRPDGSSTDLNSLKANHGVLTRVHAAWDNKCEACHKPFEPIDGRSLLASTSTASSHSSDSLCITCHAGPSHHAAAKPEEVKSCAECHRDHQGRDFSLVRLDDAECTNCHSQLDQHTLASAKPAGSRDYARSIARFEVGTHPAFHSAFADYKDEARPVDKGGLEFNHALHMSPGIVRKPGQKPKVPADYPRLGGLAKVEGPDGAIQLDCSSCHVLDSGDAVVASKPFGGASTSLPNRNGGQYFLPVSFENNCRACHELNVAAGSNPVEVPHGIQPEEVSKYLRQALAARLFEDKPELIAGFVPEAAIPGKSPALDQSVARLLNDAVAVAEQSMFADKTNCKECHGFEPVAAGSPTRIKPTNVPDVWFSHAIFDHTAHRGVSCRDCHARSYAREDDGKTLVKDASTTHLDVLLPGIDNCVKCHAPAKSDGGWFSAATTSTGGVSASCVECHRYHNGDRPLQGGGALAQDASLARSLADFLNASAPPVKPTKP